MDSLIVAAIIEARSCERFFYLMDTLPDEISKFYGDLVLSESRHFKVYLGFASDENKKSKLDFELKLNELLDKEADLPPCLVTHLTLIQNPVLISCFRH